MTMHMDALCGHCRACCATADYTACTGCTARIYCPDCTARLLQGLLRSYPGPISLVAVQFPDPHTTQHTERHVVQPALVRGLIDVMVPGGEGARVGVGLKGCGWGAGGEQGPLGGQAWVRLRVCGRGGRDVCVGGGGMGVGEVQGAGGEGGLRAWVEVEWVGGGSGGLGGRTRWQVRWLLDGDVGGVAL